MNLKYEKKRIRKNFSRYTNTLNIPYLLSIQKESFNKFIKLDNKNNSGINDVFNSVFPIKSYNKNIEIKYIKYLLEEPIFDSHQCSIKGLTYSSALKSEFELLIYEKDLKKIKLKKNQNIYICDIPLMSEKGSFIINGTERVVVSQLHRSPGVFFNCDKDKYNLSEKNLYNARIIPYRGSWLDFEFDFKNNIFSRIDKKRKFPVTVLLHAINFSNEEILNIFFDKIIISFNLDKFFIDLKLNNLENKISEFDIIYNNIIYIKKGNIFTSDILNNIYNNNINKVYVNKSFIINKISVKNYYDDNGNIIIKSNQILNELNIYNILKSKINSNIEVISEVNSKYGHYISNTLKIDSTENYTEAVTEIYKIIKPGEVLTLESASIFFNNLFFSEDKYSLSDVGRMKLNKSLERKHIFGINTLTKEDIIDVIKKLIYIKENSLEIDDIDNLGNRRVRSVGEITENQLRIGFIKIEKIIREKLSSLDDNDNLNINIQDLINPKQISIIIKDFFSSSQLSQFMDQNNPLAEITHKRRISALGPGGLTRERAGFEVRDVHPTHYGKLCPIETPEGPNIGLINSLALYARINDYGFLETPYLLVKNGKISDKIHYLSSIEEKNFVIAQATLEVDLENNFINDYIMCRYKGEFLLFNKYDVNYIDSSAQQIVSVGASLIPFLEHNDANRALMGANMQRQAVPTVKTEVPLIGTGMERIVSTDSGASIVAIRPGKVVHLDCFSIFIEINNNKSHNLEYKDIDIYKLKKFIKSNQNTCINNTPCVDLNDYVKEGDILADGSSTNLGELALGQNIRVAFMSWNGYNFEDSILISEKLIHEGKFDSIHIHEFSCVSRDTKLGAEEITCDIPNVSNNYISKLDQSGIVYIGANVIEGDILVGKITPKIEDQLSPEEKLLKAIFGDKASNVKDTSLRLPSGLFGTVIDVQIFNKNDENKDKRSLDIEHINIEKEKKELIEEKNILKKLLINKINKMFNTLNIIKLIENNINYINIDNLNLNISESVEKNNLLHLIHKFNKLDEYYSNKINISYNKIKKNEELPSGVLKIVKVFIAVKKQIQTGDKMSGRHGNKGVVSKINPIEDMPYDIDGNIIDIILNPLGVPSRMNIGQILESHLGFAAKKLGENINKLIKFEKCKYKLKEYIKDIYKLGDKIQQKIDFDNFTDQEIDILAKNLIFGVPISSPVFDGATEKDIKDTLKMSGLPESGQITLFDGCTGNKFDRKITVGYIYMMKLNHLVDDKIHARSTGSYSLITQQPLGGKSKFGGQRFGEMEVWALEAYGAAYSLQEMLTIKSDDVSGRNNIYKNIINSNYHINSNIPESFNVLFKEIKSLGINIELDKD